MNQAGSSRPATSPAGAPGWAKSAPSSRPRPTDHTFTPRQHPRSTALARLLPYSHAHTRRSGAPPHPQPHSSALPIAEIMAGGPSPGAGAGAGTPPRWYASQYNFHPHKPALRHRFMATALGATMWFWIFYRASKDGPVLLVSSTPMQELAWLHGRFLNALWHAGPWWGAEEGEEREGEGEGRSIRSSARDDDDRERARRSRERLVEDKLEGNERTPRATTAPRGRHREMDGQLRLAQRRGRSLSLCGCRRFAEGARRGVWTVEAASESREGQGMRGEARLVRSMLEIAACSTSRGRVRARDHSLGRRYSEGSSILMVWSEGGMQIASPASLVASLTLLPR